MSEQALGQPKKDFLLSSGTGGSWGFTPKKISRKGINFQVVQPVLRLSGGQNAGPDKVPPPDGSRI